VIVSVDSMQAYRGMDIGTAKPSSDIRRRIPHRMIDIVDPSEDLAAPEFQRIGRNAITAALESHGKVVIVGGSGLHFRSLVDPLSFAPTDPQTKADLERLSHQQLVAELVDVDPTVGEHVDLENPRRVLRALEIHRLTGQSPTQRATSAEAEAERAYQAFIPFSGFGIDAGDRSDGRVSSRFESMVEMGLLDEVATLAPVMGRNASQAVGYKELLPVVAGTAQLADAVDAAIVASNHLVKRQRTFFRRDPRITWLAWQDDEDARIERAADSIGRAIEWTS
jgi:tRNA dimethylallyltransferase